MVTVESRRRFERRALALQHELLAQGSQYAPRHGEQALADAHDAAGRNDSVGNPSSLEIEHDIGNASEQFSVAVYNRPGKKRGCGAQSGSGTCLS
jgi:hypothetical protein